MNPQEYAAKWRGSRLKETSAYVSHFDELCRVLGHPTPSDADPNGDFFTYQRLAVKDTGEPGFADVWLKTKFGLEYKGKGVDLDKAYQQLLKYRDNLYNPSLLIVSDFETFEIHTNFNDTVSEVYKVTLDHIANSSLRVERQTAQGKTERTSWSGFEILKLCFENPEKLKPGQTAADLTKEAAERFQSIAKELQGWMPKEDRAIARFLSRLIFCMFASDIGALPKGIITQIADNTPAMPQDAFSNAIASLFHAMSTGGPWGAFHIYHFNGGLFDGEFEHVHSDGMVRGEIKRADQLDWSQIEPAVFGTLFERIFNPERRAQLGRHYTSREDIELLVEPVVMKPLCREWEDLRSGLAADAAELKNPGRPQPGPAREKARNALQAFMDRLAEIRILDPACGSGNFLYVSLALLKELEQQVITFGAACGVFDLQPRVHPRQLYGIEIDPYAHELASIVAWIGYLQWKRRNGIPFESEIPILEPLKNIRLMDAVMEDRKGKEPREPEWPDADYIVGNPPFLGSKGRKPRGKSETTDGMRAKLGDEYVDRLFNLWDGRVRRESDFCCYWFEKARSQMERGKAKRAGLLATQSIRNGASRNVLSRIKETGDIFFAQADRPWIQDGASVRISMVGFDDGSERERFVNGEKVDEIHADLSGLATDVTTARRLKDNEQICFQGPVIVGPFYLTEIEAQRMLKSPNPHGKPNGDVVVPVVNARDITGRPQNRWVVDFRTMTEEQAALYEAPFEYVRKHVKPLRKTNRDRQRREKWWQHGRPGTNLRKASAGLERMILTPRVAKHRLFVWAAVNIVPDSRVFAFARDDDAYFGVLHSRPHEVWSLATSSRHGVGNDPTYNNTTCFETFPFPRPTKEQKQVIAEAARGVNELRENWLNPPENSVGPSELKRRTLTNLYNERPTWLQNAHRNLDHAVFDAYGWPHDISDEDILARLLTLNLDREPV